MAKDPYWPYVSVLMHGESLLETVSSTNTTTASGNTTGVVDTSRFLYGSSSLHYTSTHGWGKLLNSAALDFGDDAFTIEFSINLASNPIYKTIFGTDYSGSGLRSWRISCEDGPLRFYYVDASNVTQYYNFPTNLTTYDEWWAICVQRDDYGGLTLWANLYSAGTTNYSSYSGMANVSSGGRDLGMGPQNLSNWIDEVRITKGIARYTTSTYALPTEAFPESQYEIFSDTLSDEIVVAYSEASFGNFLDASVDDSVSMLDGIVAGYPRNISNSLTITNPAPSVAWRVSHTASDALALTETTNATLGMIIRDFANLADSIGVKTKYTHALSELVQLQERLALGQQVAIQDSVSVTWALGVVQGARIAEQLGLSEVLNYPFRYRLTTSETLRLYDALANFFHFDISETISVQDTMGALARHFVRLDQAATVSETLTPRLVLSATASDEAVLDDNFSVKMLYRPEVWEQVTFTAIFAAPDGGVTTWALNTRTGAVTEYENYDFNSFANLGVHYLGASADGLYALDGDDDDGTPTIARLKSGYAQFGGSRFTAFKAAYLGIRGDGNIYLKLDTADGRSYTYKTVIQDQQTTKVRLGKGLRARYFAFELTTEGQDFDLDNVEFIPMVATRRV